MTVSRDTDQSQLEVVRSTNKPDPAGQATDLVMPIDLDSGSQNTEKP